MPSGNVGTFAKKLITALSYVGSNTEYIGNAEPGANKASAVWRISKLSYSGDDLTDIQFADGDEEFDNIWDNRASLNFS